MAFGEPTFPPIDVPGDGDLYARLVFGSAYFASLACSEACQITFTVPVVSWILFPRRHR